MAKCQYRIFDTKNHHVVFTQTHLSFARFVANAEPAEFLATRAETVSGETVS